MVLAAGSARRFGSTKQLVDVAGRPLVAHAVAVANAAGVDAVHLVVGHDADAVIDAARLGGDVEVVRNDHHLRGQSTSLHAGVRSATVAGADVLVVLLADEPDVDARVVARVAAAVTGSDAPVARASYRDGPGHPVAFHRSVFHELEAVTGDRGAREVIARGDVVDVRVDVRRPRDVDTPDDLRTTLGPDGRPDPPDTT